MSSSKQQRWWGFLLVFVCLFVFLSSQQSQTLLATSAVKIRTRGKMRCFTASLWDTHILPGLGVRWTAPPTRYVRRQTRSCRMPESRPGICSTWATVKDINLEKMDPCVAGHRQFHWTLLHLQQRQLHGAQHHQLGYKHRSGEIRMQRHQRNREHGGDHYITSAQPPRTTLAFPGRARRDYNPGRDHRCVRETQDARWHHWW